MRLLAVLLFSLSTAALRDPSPRPEAGDRVVLRNGKTLEGRVVYEDEALVVLRIKSKDREIPRQDITSVHSALRSLGAILDELARVPSDDVARLVELADLCEAEGLPTEARLLRLQVVLQQPAHEAANEALGHKRRKEGWEAKIGNRWFSVDKLREKPSSWDDRWVLDTLHYQIASDLPLWDVLGAAFDLERILREFYGLVGAELKLADVTEIMLVEIHAGSKSYPELGDGRQGYFEPGSRILQVLAEHEPLRATLPHEAVHQLHHMTTQRSQRGKGSIPSWLDEGLAEYVLAGVSPGPGPLAFERGRGNRSHFVAHVEAEKRYTLNRMLTMETGDFMASTNTSTKYGQAYSLVHFLLHGEDGRNRPIFFEFLRSAYEGQSSMTEFKRALDGQKVAPEAFEEKWHAYAETMAS